MSRFGNFCVILYHLLINPFFNKGDTAGDESSKNECCDKRHLRSLGDERTSCRGFISQKCQSPEFFEVGKSPCQDWKLAQFLKNRVEPCKNEMDPNGTIIVLKTQMHATLKYSNRE